MNLTTLKKVTDFEWELPKQGDMKVPGKIFGNTQIIDHLISDVKKGKEWNALVQIANVACLPGIQRASIALSDVHPGYGFPIGGVAAFDPEEGGVVCMGGIGFDINCGVVTIKTDLKKEDINSRTKQLLDILYRKIPAGLGSEGKIHLSVSQLDDVLRGGAEWSIEHGYGRKEDLEFIEEHGKMIHADPGTVSSKAKQRQLNQVGTLGSGNHYLEVQYVADIYDESVAKVYGLERDGVVISIHTGSRALGHQIGTDYLKDLAQATKKYNIKIRDKDLVCAPILSPEGERYYSAVCAGINCAFANREVITHLVREAFHEVFPDTRLDLLYHIGHNTCKQEEHYGKLVYVHRKGSTRDFGPGREEIPSQYREVGQPVIVGGTMGTCSFILHGTKVGMEKSFGSAIHGAGRQMSRQQAKKEFWGENVVRDLEKKGIHVKGHSLAGIAEEAPGAYKDIINVVDCMHHSGISKKVAMLKPLINIKG
ncbi:MAG: RtcB family protein [Theionarchaea archaeon]|nr:RtcB family protein [Theionarchaea archaeon]